MQLILLAGCLAALIVLVGPSLEVKAQVQPTPTTAPPLPEATTAPTDPAATTTSTFLVATEVPTPAPVTVTPTPPAATVTPTLAAATATPTPAATGGTVAGAVFEDLNGDGLKGDDEPALVNVPVTLRVRGGGAAARRQTTTGPDGLYQFAGLAVGPYRLDIDPPAQFVAPDEDQLGINVAGAGETTRVDFALVRGSQATPTATPPTPQPATATPTPTRAPASPVASPSPVAAAAKPTGAPLGTTPRAGGFPAGLALSLLGGGAAALGAGAYLLRRRRRR